MATANPEVLRLNDTEVSPPREAERSQNQPPSTTLSESSESNTPTTSEFAFENDPEGSNNETSEKENLITWLRPTPALSTRQPEITSAYRVPSQIPSLDEYGRGYGRLAAFEDCDPNFLIYRKFGWLHNRLLLHLQDEIQVLENNLLSFDKFEATRGNPRFQQSCRLDNGRQNSKRRAILTDIKAKLDEYDDMLFRLQKLYAIKRPTKMNQSSMYQFTTENLVDMESYSPCRTDDLAALAPDAEHGWFNGFLEGMLEKVPKTILMAIFRNKEQKTKTGAEPDLFLVSPARFEALLRAILTIFAVGSLVIPVLILFMLQPENASQVKNQNKYQMLTIFLSTLFASASCSIFFKARKQEVFTATAAYCAVLAVFWVRTSQVMVASPEG